MIGDTVRTRPWPQAGKVTRRRVVVPAPSVILRHRYGSLLLALPLVTGIVLAMALGLTTVATAGAMAAMATAVVAPAIGLATLALMAPLVSPPVPAPGFSALLVGAIILGCLYRLPFDRPDLRVPFAVLPMLAFIAYVLVQQSPDMLAGYSTIEGRRVGYLFIQLATATATAVAAGYVIGRWPPHGFVAAGLVGAGLAATLTIVTFDASHIPAVLANLVAASSDLTRATGTFGNPNYFGHFLATATVAALAWAASAGSSLRRSLLLAAAALTGLALALSLSRGAIVALLVGVAVLAFARSRLLGTMVVTAAITLTVLVYPRFVEWRLENLTGSPSAAAYAAMEASDEGRLDAVLAGLDLFASAPLFGIGFGQYSALSGQFIESAFGRGAHNWYMNVLAEQGLVGLPLIGLTLAFVVLRLRASPVTPRTVGFAVLGTYTAGWLFQGSPTDFQTSALPVIVIVAAMAGDWAVAARRVPASAEPSELPAPAPTGVA